MQRRDGEERGEWRREERYKIVWMWFIIDVVEMLFFPMKLLNVSISLGPPGNMLPGKECKS